MSDVIKKIVNLCAEFVGGPWVTASPDCVIFKDMPNGFLNATYYVEMREDLWDKNAKEPRKLIIHTYGSDLVGQSTEMKIVGEAGEIAVIERLSQIGLAPKLYGVFPGGRIEEYIESRSATYEDLARPETNAKVARRIAQLHCQNMPVSKEPKTMHTVYGKVGAKVYTGDLNSLTEAEKLCIDEMFSFPAEAEYSWLCEAMPKIESKVVFCHNDLYPSNIVICKGTEDPFLLDFDICGYFHRAYDLACHMQPRHIQLVNLGNKKLKYVPGGRFTEEEKIKFLTNYLDELKQNGLASDELRDNLSHLEMEFDFFSIFDNIVWLNFVRLSQNQSEPRVPAVSKTVENINYLSKLQQVGKEIVETYWANKQAFLDKYGDPLRWHVKPSSKACQ